MIKRLKTELARQQGYLRVPPRYRNMIERWKALEDEGYQWNSAVKDMEVFDVA